MFNLLISGLLDSWDGGSYELELGSRFAIEYTADEISERYKTPDKDARQELMSFPCLFVIEREEKETRIGYITELKLRRNTVLIRFEFDTVLPVLPIGTIEQIGPEIDLGKWELSRTHWAIKDEQIFEILVRREILTQEQVTASYARRFPSETALIANGGQNEVSRQVFIVHGHDDIARYEVAKFIKNVGLEPIVLLEQASSGMTIIEKLEHYTEVEFGIVLYTPCDVGHRNGDLNSLYRARQNVVFEHGYLIARLGRNRVTALVKGDIEIPNDISGVVYVKMNEAGDWQDKLLIELRGAGYQI